MKGKAGKSGEHWMTRDIEAPVKKKEKAYVGYRQLGSSEPLEKCKGNGESDVTKKMDEGRAVDIVYLDGTDGCFLDLRPITSRVRYRCWVRCLSFYKNDLDEHMGHVV
eukprot:g36250.t1